ncbi:MAG: peptidylprolyl isomerase, partial [Syntrophales bacterium]|nr:peptidylprolyl isomerase [Syntrophales bacterium]
MLTKATLEKDFQERLKEIANKLPKDKLKEVSLNLKRTLIDEFIVRTLLQNEVRKRKITVSDQEIKAAVTRMEDNLPQGVTFAEMMRKSGLSREKLNEEVALGIQVNKLIAQQAKGKADPTDKEIQDFYRNNKEKFKMPESVHVRHILIGIAKGDDASIRDQKRRKAEDLRQQLLAGADFAALAKENSDCPSKSQGGDL